MALPTVAELKNRLRIETSAEDSDLTSMLAEGKAWAGKLLRRPMTATSKVMGDLWAYRNGYNRHVIYSPIWPAQSSGLVLKDRDGATVNSGDYTVDVDTGRIVAATGKYFGNGPYEITATAGYSAGTAYSTEVEPLIRSLIFGLCEILYEQRNPNASSDSGGGGVAVAYQTRTALPEHLLQLVDLINGPRIR